MHTSACHVVSYYHHATVHTRCIFLSFFFQAEDGIRGDLVTGVQTCALPICFSMANSHGGSTTRATPMPRTGNISSPGRTSSSTITRHRGNFLPISRFFGRTQTPWLLIPSCSQRRSKPESTFTSKGTRSQEGGVPLTTQTSSQIGSRISSAGTPLTSDGAVTERRTSSGA